MVLKLKVHWSDDHLTLNYRGLGGAIGEFGDSSPHVQRPEGEEGDVVVQGLFEECNRVPDVVRYRVSAGRGDYGRYRICDSIHIVPCTGVPVSQLQPQPSNVVLLLESPHSHEYERGHISTGIGSPMVPACGETGTRIDMCLGTVLLHVQETGSIAPPCHVVVSNPIQFQTSLHAVHGQSMSSNSKWRTLRDKVWRELWAAEGDHIQQDFLARLDTFHPSVIINACTAKLRGHVSSTVRSWRSGRHPDVRLFEIGHPSSWQDLRPRLS